MSAKKFTVKASQEAKANKTYIKSSSDEFNLKEAPTFDKFLKKVGFQLVDDDYEIYAMLRGNDLITYCDDDEYFYVWTNGAKYADEICTIDYYEEGEEEFLDEHPDVKEDTVLTWEQISKIIN